MRRRHPLERLLCPRDPVAVIEDAGRGDGRRQARKCVEARPGTGSPVWLAAGDWRLYVRASLCEPARGEVLETFRTADGGELTVRWDPEEAAVSVPFSLSEAFASYVSEAWRAGATERPRLSAGQLDLFYRVKGLIPRRMQLAARRALVRRQSRPSFPAWPFDASMQRLVELYARCAAWVRGESALEFRWFWPEAQHAALVLTHDVETADGLRLALEIADLEEERGLRSSFNIVASWYPIDRGILRELRSRGFELGLHGVHHDRSMFASRASFDSQQPRLREWARELDAEGFRSPATHRVFEWLADLPVSYDCTIPHSDPYEPIPGGCCTAWPFFIGGVIELPYTMPQDHTLFTLLGHRSIDVWVEQMRRVKGSYGLVQLVTHPDPGYLGDLDKRRLYAEMLDAIREEPSLWRALPRDVARWWRERDGDEREWQHPYGVAVLDSQGRAHLQAPSKPG